MVGLINNQPELHNLNNLETVRNQHQEADLLALLQTDQEDKGN